MDHVLNDFAVTMRVVLNAGHYGKQQSSSSVRKCEIFRLFSTLFYWWWWWLCLFSCYCRTQAIHNQTFQNFSSTAETTTTTTTAINSEQWSTTLSPSDSISGDTMMMKMRMKTTVINETRLWYLNNNKNNNHRKQQESNNQTRDKSNQKELTRKIKYNYLKNQSTMKPFQNEDNQTESNNTITISSPFLNNSNDNVSDVDDILSEIEGIDDEIFSKNSNKNHSDNENDDDVEITNYFVNVTTTKNVGDESITSVNKNTNISKIDEMTVSYTRKKSEHLKKLLENKSHRSRVNSVFELSSKMMFNSTINNSYRNARAGKISLLGLFELTTQHGTRPEGISEVYAAELAVKHINDRKILPGYTLELLTNDTKCDPGVGVDRFFHALYTRHTTRMVMLLGSACSEVTESLAKIVPYWNILQVSFGSTSPALSDRREFPLFYRTVAPDSSHNPARIAFIRKFGWDTVTTFSQNEEIYSLAINDLVTELESANISCTATITFAETDFKDQIRMLRDLDTRIIIGSFSDEVAPKIFCEAYKLNMYGTDYAWIVQEDLGSLWWLQSTDDCTIKQLQAVVENMIIVSSHNSIVGEEFSYSGLNNTMFLNELRQMNVPPQLSRYAPQTYDAVWAIALAMRGAEEFWRNISSEQPKLDRFDYTRYDMAMEFLHQFSQLNFLGVSGPVSFDGADRIGTSAFYQVQKSNIVHISLYYPETQHLDFYCPQCVAITWHKGQIPIAKRILKLRVATIAPIAFYTITALASVGILLTIGFLAFNLHFRKLKAIKLSSPKLSNITAVGCILVYAAVILLGLDYSTLPAIETIFPAVCTARVSLLSSGFSLAFGSMFAKTYRVHRIFTSHSGGGICKDRILQDSKLILLVCALLVIDGLVVILWVISDPMERHLSNLTLEISSVDRSVVYQPQVEVCRSQHTSKWLGILYIYKGLLLVVGVYMAWETRHVKISALNDSQYIGISVYSVVITSASVVVLANLLAERVTLSFIIITSFILISTTATLCLLFLPKIRDIWRRDNHDPVVHSMGLKIECNTRRFVMDDSKEIHYRVEVQNRVYKKEMAALDAEIQKLEKMILEPHLSSTSSSTTSLSHHLKTELTKIFEQEPPQPAKSRAPSITGGLPLLLLSVLPPVIPRASWPSAEHMSVPMRRSVTFSSEPHMDEESGRLPAIDLFNLRLRHQKCMENKSILDRIKGIFGSRAPSRKTSSASISGQGLTAAFKAHMGLLTGLVPGANSTSCNTLNVNAVDPKVLRRPSLAKSGTAINIEITEPEFYEARSRRKSSIAVLSNRDLLQVRSGSLTQETKVNFLLPPNRRPSIFQTEPTLRERIKGSPRFPHKINPTCSLNSLGEETIVCEENGKSDDVTERRAKRYPIKTKWKSMDESTSRGCQLPILKIPSSSNDKLTWLRDDDAAENINHLQTSNKTEIEAIISIAIDEDTLTIEK